MSAYLYNNFVKLEVLFTALAQMQFLLKQPDWFSEIFGGGIQSIFQLMAVSGLMAAVTNFIAKKLQTYGQND